MASRNDCTSAAVRVATAALTFFGFAAVPVCPTKACPASSVARDTTALNFHRCPSSTSFFLAMNEKAPQEHALLDHLDGIFLFRRHAVWQRCIIKRSGHLLAVGDHPVQKIR